MAYELDALPASATAIGGPHPGNGAIHHTDLVDAGRLRRGVDSEPVRALWFRSIISLKLPPLVALLLKALFRVRSGWGPARRSPLDKDPKGMKSSATCDSGTGRTLPKSAVLFVRA